MELETDELLQALANLWNDLPDLLGQAWPEVQSRLQWVLAHAAQDRNTAGGSLKQKLRWAFEGHPEVEEWLARARWGPVRTRGGAPVTRGGLPPLTRSDGKDLTDHFWELLTPRTVIRSTDISYPERVAVQCRRFPVVVRLTVAGADAGGKGNLTVQENQTLDVHLDAPGFEVLSGAVQRTPVRQDADSPPVIFDLRPVQAGQHRLVFSFFQKNNPVGTASVPIECFATAGSAAPPAPAASAVQVDTSALPPDMVLLIAAHTSPPELRFTLMRDGGASWQTFRPVRLVGSTADAAKNLFRQMTVLAVRSDPATAAQGVARPRLMPGEVDQRVRAVGRNLWNDLVPPDLRELYARERNTWRNRSLLLQSDDPHLPWELVWPYGTDWNDDMPWCCTLRMTRWLPRDAQGSGNANPPARLPLCSMAVLAPTDSGLPTAQRERQFLRALIAGYGLKDVSPERATWTAVHQLLEQGDYDWVHASAHGKFHEASPDGDSVVWLEDRASLTPATVVGPEIEGHIRRRRPAFVFNACEVGQQGWGLTRMGGWATRLLSAGAGLFIGPLWEVTDEGAMRFAEAFYRLLHGGATVGEAVCAARLRARQAGDPTWLAYSVYAHPNARAWRVPECG